MVVEYVRVPLSPQWQCVFCSLTSNRSYILHLIKTTASWNLSAVSSLMLFSTETSLQSLDFTLPDLYSVREAFLSSSERGFG